MRWKDEKFQIVLEPSERSIDMVLNNIRNEALEEAAEMARTHDRFNEAKSGDTDASAYAKGHGRACEEIADAIRELKNETI